MKYFICFTLRANISASDYFTKWVSEDQLEIRSLITASVRSIFRTDMQYYNQRWNVCRNYNKYKSGGMSPNSSIFLSISMLFPIFTNRWEEVTWKRRKNRFRVEQVWTLKSGYTEHWGIQRAGPLPSPPPSQKKEGGWERDLWVAIERVKHLRQKNA